MVMTLSAFPAATIVAAAAKAIRNVRLSVPLVPRASPLIPSHCQTSPIGRARSPRPFGRAREDADWTGPDMDGAYGTDTRCGIVGSIATGVTGLFGNDAYDDYIFFDRYRVYVGKTPKVDCFGAFGK